MATEQQIMDPAEEEQQLSERIVELEELLQQSERLRKQNFLAVSVSLLLMLIILGFFIVGLVSFFQQYPKRSLMQEVFRQSRQVLVSGVSKNNTHAMDTYTVNMIQKEMRAVIKKNLPQLRQEVRHSVRSFKMFVDTQLKKDFRSRMYDKLMIESKSYLVSKNISADKQLLKQLSVMNSELASKITEQVFAQLNESRQSGELFRQELNNLQRSQEYRNLALLPKNMVEDRFIESLLECCICSINKNKGMEPAVPGGF